MLYNAHKKKAERQYKMYILRMVYRSRLEKQISSTYERRNNRFIKV